PVERVAPIEAVFRDGDLGVDVRNSRQLRRAHHLVHVRVVRQIVGKPHALAGDRLPDRLTLHLALRRIGDAQFDLGGPDPAAPAPPAVSSGLIPRLPAWTSGPLADGDGLALRERRYLLAARVRLRIEWCGDHGDALRAERRWSGVRGWVLGQRVGQAGIIADP